MMDIKRLTAGIIAGAAITAGPFLALAAPASAATNASNPFTATAAPQQRMHDQQGGGASFTRASHCGGGINCDYCGCR
jgi:hypothetical protein